MLSDLLGKKSEHQFCCFRRVGVEKLGRAIDGEQAEVRTPEVPEFSDEAADDLLVTVATEWAEICRGEWRRWRPLRAPDEVQQSCGQLACRQGDIGQAVRRRLEALNDVEQFARPAAHGRLVALDELVMWEEFLHERHGRALVAHGPQCAEIAGHVTTAITSDVIASLTRAVHSPRRNRSQE